MAASTSSLLILATKPTTDDGPPPWYSAIRCDTIRYNTFFHHYQGSIDFNTVNIHHTAGMYFLVFTGNRDDIEWHDLQRSYYPFSLHQQGRIDLNTVNTNWGEGDISWYTPKNGLIRILCSPPKPGRYSPREILMVEGNLMDLFWWNMVTIHT